MSVTLMSEVWTLQLTSGHRDVLLILADHANDEGVCWPSIGLIAWKTDKNPRSIRRTLRELEDAGIVKCIANHEGGRGLSRVYQLHLDKGDKKSAFVRANEDREEAGHLTSGTTSAAFDGKEKGDTSSSFPKRVTSEVGPQKEGVGARNPDADARNADTAMSPEPSLEPPGTTNSPEGVEKEPTPINAGKILGEILKAGTKYPRSYRGHLGRQVHNLLKEDFAPDVVRAAAKKCVEKGLPPSTMPSLVVEVQNGNGNGNGHQPFDPSSQDYTDSVVR